MSNTNFRNFLPFDSQVEKELEQLTAQLNQNQLSWLGGYFTALAKATGGLQLSNSEKSTTENAIDKPVISLLYGTQTGNAQKIISQAQSKFEQQGYKTQVSDLAEIDKNKLKQTQYVFIAVSTYGEGVPPPAIEGFYEFIHSKKAPKLNHIKFGVLGLGDSSYAQYCQTGKDVDAMFEKLGAKRIVDRTDVDLDWEDDAEAWTSKIVDKTNELSGTNNKNTPTTIPLPSVISKQYSKKNPYKAEILDRIKLNAKGSNKSVFHFELSLEDSGLTYQPGDAVGIIPKNPEPLVNDLISKLNFDGSSIYKNGFEDSVKNHLQKHYEISLLSKDFLVKYNEKAKNNKLASIIKTPAKLKDFLDNNDVYDVINEFPTKFSPEEFIPLLPKLKPRLYSIASSSKVYPDEVHLTVGELEYESNNRQKKGICSNMIAEQLTLDDDVEIYIDENPIFRLPEDDKKPIIMIGPGTGIAPFRAFVQERVARNAEGKNWVFFGEQHFTTDFLYQTEWQNYLKKGVINKFDVAFSRDQAEKIYVQHKIEQNASEFYNWLEQGAIIYVCGDKDKMAKDVLETITKVIETEGKLSKADAEAYVKKLRSGKRYLEDVY